MVEFDFSQCNSDTWTTFFLNPKGLGFDDEDIAEFDLNNFNYAISVKYNAEDNSSYDLAWVSNYEEVDGRLSLEFYKSQEVEELMGLDFSRFKDQFHDEAEILASGAIEKCTERQVNLLASITVEAMCLGIHSRKMERYIDYVTPPPKNGGATVTNIKDFCTKKDDNAPDFDMT